MKRSIIALVLLTAIGGASAVTFWTPAPSTATAVDLTALHAEAQAALDQLRGMQERRTHLQAEAID